ncbi:MAG: hypothetical protein WBV92_09540, partial [Nitrosotalea sp.]
LTGTDGTIIDQTPPLTDTQGDSNTWQRIYDGLDTGSPSDWTFKTGTPGTSNGAAPTTTVTSQVGMSVSTDKQNYIFGDIVNIGGQVSQIVNNPAVTSVPTTVNLVVLGPNGFKQTFSLYPGTDLKFSTYMKTDQILGFAQGTYSLSASYGNAQASTTFTLGSAAFIPPTQVAPTTLVISTDRSNYTTSQPFVLSGTVSTVIPLTPVQYKVYDPTNIIVSQGSQYPDSQGRITTANQYQTSAGSSGLVINTVNPTYGIYRVTATYGSTSAFTTFVLLPTQVQSQPILISTDKQVYAPGDTVVVSGSTQLAGLQNSGLSPTIEITQASFTSGSIPVSFDVKDFVTAGTGNTFTYSFTIPAISDRLGNYGVKVTSPFGTAYTSFAVSANPSTYTPVNSGPFSISIDKLSYAYGDTILISGQVRPDLISGTGVQVMVSVLNSNGSQVMSLGSTVGGYGGGSCSKNCPTVGGSAESYAPVPVTYSVTPDVNGFYSLSQTVLPNIFSQPGNYTFVAKYGASLQASTTFSVYNPLTGTASNPISASTDKNVYGVGDTVQLTGHISSSVATNSYTLTLVKPSGNQITFPLQVNNGQFSWTWTIPTSDATGSAVITTDLSASGTIDPTRAVYGIYRITISSNQASSELFFQVSQNPQSNQSLSPLSVETDKTNYLSTDVANIWGQVIPTQNAATAVANSLVAVTIYSNGQQAYQGTAAVNPGGQYFITIPFHPGSWPNGTYNLYATYLTNQVTTSFNISDPFSTSSGSLRLIMTTDSDKYLPGQTVLLTGRTSSIISLQTVDLAIGMTNDTVINEGQVASLTGKNIPTATVSLDQYGSFSYHYTIPANTPIGNYTIIAQAPFGAFNAYFDVVNQLPVKQIPIITNQTQTVPSSVAAITPTLTTIPLTIGPVDKHAQSNMFVTKVNQISDSVIPITLAEKPIGNLTYYPRELDGLLRVNPGDENAVSINVNSQNGTCIIGQNLNCLVTQSTAQSGMLYQTVAIDGKNFLVGYSGPGLRLQQFSIVPAATNDVMPDGQWKVYVIKDNQVTRFYYQVTYVGK